MHIQPVQPKDIKDSIKSITAIDPETLGNEIDDVASKIKDDAEKEKKKTTSQLYAIIQREGANVDVISATQKKDLSQQLSSLPEGWKILHVFKGKQLQLREKKAFNFI